MWSKPWSYKEGLVIGAGLLVIGILLQMAVGAINWGLFACPVNAIVLVVYIIALVAMHLLRKRVYLFGWLSHYSAAVSSLVWVAGMTVIMGLIRQAPSGHASNDILGFSQMISSWPFVLLYFWMVTVLGLTIFRASFPFRIGRLSFLLNHVGLLVALITATLGNADMQRLKMTTRMGNAEWRATDDKGKLIELPLAIELKDFTIDEYPPKLMLIDNETGGVLPEKSPVHLLLENGVSEGSLLDWDLFVEQSIPMAASVATDLFSNFQKNINNGEIVILTDVRNRNSESIGYIATYIIPFIFQCFNTRYEIFAFTFLMIIIYRIYVNSNLLLINPILSFKYSIFEIEYIEQRGKKRNGLIIIEDKYILEDTMINIYPIGYKLFFAKNRE